MVSDDLARRFLHVNLNCESLDAVESLYAGALGLSTRMRTDPAVPTNGAILGMDDETYCETAFLYDSRGGRDGCALEAIAFHTPGLKRDPSVDPSRPGIRSTLFWVADLDAATDVLRDLGVTIGDPVDGLISGAKARLAVDNDGNIVELAQAPSDIDASKGALFSGIRISSIDTAATAEFLTAIGFAEVEEPATVSIAGDQLSPGVAQEAVDCVIARFALPEDAHRFTVTVVQHPDTESQDPVSWGGNRQGLYRCALRVESVDKALAALPESVEVQSGPVWCPLPGTKIDGLYIAFLCSPDGVVFEFVERPLAFFTR